jgi:hypothetical protein
MERKGVEKTQGTTTSAGKRVKAISEQRFPDGGNVRVATIGSMSTLPAGSTRAIDSP